MTNSIYYQYNLAAAQYCGCADVVSQGFFDGLTSQADPSCEAKGFYTRDAFLAAWQSYPGFAEGPTIDDSKREIAAFFAHVFHETIRMLSILLDNFKQYSFIKFSLFLLHFFFFFLSFYFYPLI